MRRYAPLLALVIMTSGSLLQAQELVPHPYAYGGPEAMGGGYSPFTAVGGAGLRIDSQRFLLDASGSYDGGHKTNDNDQPNPKGHDRGLVGSAYYRVNSGWFVGGGARWSQLSTTNYAKNAWRPTFGGGKDFFHKACAAEDCVADFSMRVGIDYVMSGTDKANGSQGPLLSLYLPSPSAKGHIFYRESVGIYRFHDTITDPANLLLTREQSSDHSWDTFAEFTVMYRF